MTGIRFFLAAVVTITGQQAFAQLPQTRITSVFPPGGQQGTTLDLTVGGGTDLDELDQMVFAHPGITAVQKRDASGNPVANTFAVTVAPDVPAGLYDGARYSFSAVTDPAFLGWYLGMEFVVLTQTGIGPSTQSHWITIE